MRKYRGKRRKKTNFPAGSMVDKSIRIGYDVRDLILMGFTDEDIDQAANGEITLEELFDRGPSPKKPAAGERLLAWLSRLFSSV